MKKKGLIITICVLVVLIIASLITKYIDTANVSTGHEPEYCIKIVSQDGGKVTYWGLGYKSITYERTSIYGKEFGHIFTKVREEVPNNR